MSVTAIHSKAMDSMPPRLECEFDFNLPHGVDAEKLHVNAQEPYNILDGDVAADGTVHANDDQNPLFADGVDPTLQPMKYNSLPKGFSDDEGADRHYDRSWEAEQARKPSPKSKKSPRRSNKGDVGDEESPRIKRLRQSLFGGPVEEAQEPEIESNLNYRYIDMDIGLNAPQPSPDFRQRISSLNLDQQEEHDTEEFQNAQDNCQFDLGLGLGSFEEDGMLATGSRAASEDSFIIPPDDQVSFAPSPAFMNSAHMYSPCMSCARTSIAQKPSPTSTRTRPVTTIRPRKRELRRSNYKRRKR